MATQRKNKLHTSHVSAGVRNMIGRKHGGYRFTRVTFAVFCAMASTTGDKANTTCRAGLSDLMDWLQYGSRTIEGEINTLRHFKLISGTWHRFEIRQVSFDGWTAPATASRAAPGEPPVWETPEATEATETTQAPATPTPDIQPQPAAEPAPATPVSTPKPGELTPTDIALLQTDYAAMTRYIHFGDEAIHDIEAVTPAGHKYRLAPTSWWRYPALGAEKLPDIEAWDAGAFAGYFWACVCSCRNQSTPQVPMDIPDWPRTTKAIQGLLDRMSRADLYQAFGFIAIPGWWEVIRWRIGGHLGATAQLGCDTLSNATVMREARYVAGQTDEWRNSQWQRMNAGQQPAAA